MSSTLGTSEEISPANATDAIEAAPIFAIPTSDTYGAVLSQTENQDARLMGLRRFLDEWNTGLESGNGRRDRSEVDYDASKDGPNCKGGREQTSKEEQETAKKYVYSAYIKHASAEDEELVRRWTETLNILLTFAGLQSAIVVAFILFQSPKLEPDPQDTPTYLLQQILHQLNNSTSIPVDPAVNWAAPDTLVRLLAWWYLSLGSSILSAFGALLSKQWVMHYQSQPAWANSDTKRAELREMRYQALASWRFYAVIESLPILLQLSLLLFVVGLIEYLKPVSSTLFIIAVILLAVGAIFYVSTLFSGAFFPFCPYQSPASDVWYKTVTSITFTLAITISALIKTAIRLVLWRLSELRVVMSETTTMWKASRVFQVGQAISREIGETSRVVKGSDGTAGIFCWWLSEENRRVVGADQPDTTMAAVADTVLEFPAIKLVDAFYQAGSFEFWAEDMKDVLDSVSSPAAADTELSRRRLNTLRMGDVLFYSMYHSPLADYVGSIQWGLKLHDYRPICNTIRTVWTGGKTVERMPILNMQWPTVAIYLRYRLLDWCVVGSAEDRAEILQELPTLLRDPRLLENIADVSNVASLAAVALVDDNVVGVCKRRQLTQEGTPKYERLFLALHRLSFYVSPTTMALDVSEQAHLTQPTDVIFSLLIKAARVCVSKMAKDPEQHRSLLYPFGERVRYPTLETGRLAEGLLRLLELGVLHRDSTADPSLCGPSPKEKQLEEDQEGTLIHEIQHFICELSASLGEQSGVQPQGLSPLCSSPEGLTRLFAGYASRLEVLPVDTWSIEAVGTALGLRHHLPRFDSRFTWRSPPSVSLHPHPGLPTSLLKEHPEILRQLIHDVQEAQGSDVGRVRQLLLAMVVQGRDLFMSGVASGTYGGLSEALSICANAMQQSGSFWCWNEDVQATLDGFNDWDQLVQALKDLEDGLSTTPDVEKPTDPEVEERASGEIQVSQRTQTYFGNVQLRRG